MNWCKIETCKGIVFFSYTNKGLYSLRFPWKNLPEAARITETENNLPWVENFTNCVQNYFLGKNVDFTSFPIDYSDVPLFSAEVLKKTHLVPYNKITSYGALAAATDSPRAYRGVGRVLARNRLPLVIPCHRVIKTDGGLGGFSSGLSWKTFMLELEGNSFVTEKSIGQKVTFWRKF